MKKLFLVAVAGLFFAANSNAQVQRQTSQHRHMQSDSSHHFQRGEMMQQLNLSEEQKTQMKALHETMQQQRSAIQNDASLTVDQKKEKMKELHKAQMEKMKTILTPEQQVKMKEWREQHKQNRPMHKKEHRMNQKEQS